jgi:hypothetical protein
MAQRRNGAKAQGYKGATPKKKKGRMGEGELGDEGTEGLRN